MAKVKKNKGLYRQLIDSPRQALKVFIASVILVFTCISMVYYCQKNIPESLEQEIYILGFMIIGSLGFISAMACHLAMLINRLAR